MRVRLPAVALLTALARGGCLTYVSNRLVGEPGWMGDRAFRDLGLVTSEVALDALVSA